MSKRHRLGDHLGLAVREPALCAARARLPGLDVPAQDALFVHFLLFVFLALARTHARRAMQRLGAPVLGKRVDGHQMEVALRIAFEILVAHEARKALVPKGRVRLVLVHVQPALRRESHAAPFKRTRKRHALHAPHRRDWHCQVLARRLLVHRQWTPHLEQQLVVVLHFETPAVPVLNATYSNDATTTISMRRSPPARGNPKSQSKQEGFCNVSEPRRPTCRRERASHGQGGLHAFWLVLFFCPCFTATPPDQRVLRRAAVSVDGRRVGESARGRGGGVHGHEHQRRLLSEG